MTRSFIFISFLLTRSYLKGSLGTLSMNIANELRKELVLMLGDAGKLTYPVLEAQTLQSVQNMYGGEKRLKASLANPDLFRAVFVDLQKHEGFIASQVESGITHCSLTPQGHAYYEQLHALYTLDTDVLVA